ncbi:MAG: helix-turn-helix domain-containing protein [Candidatus Omnitrophota bacterium]
MKIGDKLKALREARKISLTELSKLSGVALATLSRIEHKKMTGTLESHLRITRALGITLPELYSEVEPETKKPAAKNIFVHSEKSASEILTGQIASKKMMPILIKLEPEGRTAVEQATENTEQFSYVLEGEVNLTINSINYSLKNGESLYFDASLPHQFINPGKARARVLSVITPPTL